MYELNEHQQIIILGVLVFGLTLIVISSNSNAHKLYKVQSEFNKSQIELNNLFNNRILDLNDKIDLYKKHNTKKRK